MRVALATWRLALADGIANPGSFLLQLLFMIANDVVWVIFWILFFNRVGHVRGWSLGDMFVLYSVIMLVAGTTLGLLANSRRIGQLVADGGLDEALVLPVTPLAFILARRIDPANAGDAVFGLVFFFLASHPSPERVLLFLGAAVAGTTVLVSFLVICGSLTFFVGGRGEQADLGLNALVLFASYPLDLFGGATKVILFTIIPAAFVSGLPVSLVRHFDPGTAMAVMAVTALMAALAGITFTLGLRRYASGSVWVRG
jgi:ABC-2 type transport system permease protein